MRYVTSGRNERKTIIVDEWLLLEVNLGVRAGDEVNIQLKHNVPELSFDYCLIILTMIRIQIVKPWPRATVLTTASGCC